MAMGICPFRPYVGSMEGEIGVLEETENDFAPKVWPTSQKK